MQPGSEGGPGRLELLREMMRECEGLLAAQLAWIRQLDKTLEQTLALCVAVLGGILAASTFLHARDVGPAALRFLVAGGALDVLALMVLLEAYVGLLHPILIAAGPSFGWIAQKASEPDWDLQAHLEAVVKAYPAILLVNQVTTAYKTRQRRKGLGLLTLALLLVAIGYIQAASGLMVNQ